MFDKLTFEWKLVGKSKMCSGNEYKVTLTYGDKSYTFPFHTNYLDEKNDKEFLSCLFEDAFAYENSLDILDFKDEFGYEDNKECRRVYLACRDTSKRLHDLFNYQEFDDLYNEITFGE
jgi:hypothetical protein